MKNATLCFILTEDRRWILLGRKERGFGAGKYNGFGGKILPGETPRAAAAREIAEESHVTVDPKGLRDAGNVTFWFPYQPSFDHYVHVFVTTKWHGEPRDSAEMTPRWFRVDDIPYEEMWADDLHWIPLVLAGKSIEAAFTFDEDNESLSEWIIKEIDAPPGADEPVS